MSTPHDSEHTWIPVSALTFRLDLSEGRHLTAEPDSVPFRRFSWRLVLREDTRFEVLDEHIRDITDVMNQIQIDPSRYDRSPS
jgi:hypothetical protein